MEEIIYNEKIDIIIEFGKKITLNKDYIINDDEYFNSLIDYLVDEFKSNEEIFIREIEEGIKILIDSTNESILNINKTNPLLINPESEDNETEINELAENLRTINDLVFFSRGLIELSSQFPFFLEYNNKIDDFIYESALKIQSYRLIPLNEIRKKIIQGILEEYRYMFPWLIEWVNSKDDESCISEYATDSFYDIINVLINQISCNDKQITDNLKALYFEVYSNDELFNLLFKEAYNIYLTSKKIKDSPLYFSLELSRIISTIMLEKETSKYPKGLWNLTGTAAAIFKESSDILEDYFLAILCGPYLTIEERSEKLNRFFHYLYKNNIKTKNKIINNFINSFILFLETKNSDIDLNLIYFAMKLWIQKMSEINPEKVLPIKDNKSAFIAQLDDTFFKIAEKNLTFSMIKPESLSYYELPMNHEGLIKELLNQNYSYPLPLAAADEEKKVIDVFFYKKNADYPEKYIKIRSLFNYEIKDDTIYFNGKILDEINKIEKPKFLLYHHKFNIIIVPNIVLIEFPYWSFNLVCKDKIIIINDNEFITINELINTHILIFE